MEARNLALVSALSLAALTLACSGGGGGGGGTVAFVYEQEPNDFPDEADGIGYVDSNDFYRIRGSVNGFDTLDGFAFTADFPVDVEAALYIDNPFADLVVYVYDPVTDTFPFVFDDLTDPVVGSFRVNVPADFHLVVGTLHGPSGYTLEVRGFPYGSYTSTDGAAPLAVANAGRFAGPASTADDARRAALDALAEPYRVDEPLDQPEPTARVLTRGVLALIDNRGEVEMVDALVTERGAALVSRP